MCAWSPSAADTARVYVLVEHKSYSDRWALLQVLRYMVNTWSRDVADDAGKPLVPIVPIFFYHGESRSVGSDFSGLFGAEYAEQMRRYQPRFLCELFNLTATPDDQLDNHPRLAPALWAMKYARTQMDLALHAFNRLAAINRHLTALWLKEDVMSTAEMLIAQGIAEGEARGEARGITRGKTEGGRLGRLAVARQLKQLGMSIDQIRQVTELSAQEIEKA